MITHKAAFEIAVGVIAAATFALSTILAAGA